VKRVAYLALLLVLVGAFWNTWLLYPLKLLVVFFHEASHALTTLLTGGAVKELVIIPAQGGHVISMGGNRFLALSSGYLGSLLWGGLVYLLAVTTRKDRGVMLCLAIFILCITLYTMSPFTNSFGFFFCLMTGLFMVFSARKLSHGFNDFVLRLVGLTSMVYAPLDIISDTLVRSELRSDARMLAEEFGGTTVFWGTLWVLLSLFFVGWIIRWGFKYEKH
jgi:hypothetical protein